MEPLSIYIHIPFCIKKCFYCDFPSFAAGIADYEDYIEALVKEIKNTRQQYQGYEIQTIFLGGGTPSVLPAKLTGKIMDALFSGYSISKNAEISLEANPGTLDKKKLRELAAMDFNRLSMGMQAWQNRLLKKLGRIHTIEDFLRNYADAKKAGFQNINIDLMFSLPDQTNSDWEETLEKTIHLKPTHISCYSLIVEEGTPFDQWKREGKLNLPKEETDRQQYYLAKEMLKDAGYQQYEISNFCRDAMECRHNLVYWRDEEYIGFGLGAHSYFQNRRYHNTVDTKKYGAAKGEPQKIQEDIEKITRTMELSEFMFMGLRLTKGIEKERFFNRFGQEVKDIYQKEIDKLIEAGLLTETQEHLFLTEKGVDLSNYVFEQFLLE